MMIEPTNIIDNYRILSQVAHSNFSSTYIAERTHARKPLVLITLWHGITLTTREDVQTFLKKARHGVFFKNAQRIPLLDAQLHYQSPYIVTAFNEQVITFLDAHTKLIDQIVSNRRALHPGDPRYSINAFLRVFCTTSSTNPILDLNVLLAGNTATHTTPHIKAASKQWKPRPSRRRSYIVASIALLLALLAGGATLLITLLPANAATVTITPSSERMTHTYAITLVTRDPEVGQIREHTISYTTPPQSQTVPVTGKEHHDATKAQGQVVISQIHLFKTSDNNSSVGPSDVQTKDGTTITIDTFTATEGGSITVNASAKTAGQSGNILAYDIDGLYGIYQQDQSNTQSTPIGTAYIQNHDAFTSGQDAIDHTYVQQQDIDGVANPLIAQLTPDAQQQIQQQLQPDEQLIKDTTCSSSTNADHQAQETADSVTVTVQITCSGYVYNKQDLLTAAINAQKADVITRYGRSYQLSGEITTGTPNLSAPPQIGSAIYQIPTDGIWVFQIDKAQQQEIALSIAGHPQQEATAQLLQRKGIKSVVITTTGGMGTTLPISPENIRFTIVHVPGLTSR